MSHHPVFPGGNEEGPADGGVTWCCRAVPIWSEGHPETFKGFYSLDEVRKRQMISSKTSNNCVSCIITHHSSWHIQAWKMAVTLQTILSSVSYWTKIIIRFMWRHKGVTYTPIPHIRSSYRSEPFWVNLRTAVSTDQTLGERPFLHSNNDLLTTVTIPQGSSTVQAPTM